MAFMSILLMLFPFLAVSAAFFAGMFAFFATCLVAIGLSGLILNHLGKRHGSFFIHAFWNIGALVTGASIFLLPAAFTLYQAIMWLF